jgi:hypothetical protein
MIQENLERSRNPLDRQQLDKTQYLELTSYNTIIFVYEWRKERCGKRYSRRDDIYRYGIKMISFNKYFFKKINLI